jgi:imidazolonepropionase-like amidohydrolase
MSLFIKDAVIIDVKEGKSIKDYSILVEKDKISRIAPSSTFKREEFQKHRTIDGTGKYLIPGFINLHQHFIYKRTYGPLWEQFKLPIPVLTTRAVKNALAELKDGITTTRELGSTHGINQCLKYMIQHKFILGPRIFSAGQPLAITGGHARALSQSIDGVDEARKWTRERVQYVDWVKVFSSYDPFYSTGGELARPEFEKEELEIIAHEAHKAGKKVAAHAVGSQSIRNVIESGIDTIEHGIYLNRELAKMMKANGTVLVPTLTAVSQTLNPIYNRGAKWIELHGAVFEPQKKSFQIALEEGVKIGMGLDSLGNILEEACLMRDVGQLKPGEILKIFTLNGAEILGVANILGSIAENKIADLVLLNADPLANIENIGNISFIIKEGRDLRPEEVTLSTEYESEHYHSLIPELLT